MSKEQTKDQDEKQPVGLTGQISADKVESIEIEEIIPPPVFLVDPAFWEIAIRVTIGLTIFGLPTIATNISRIWNAFKFRVTGGKINKTLLKKLDQVLKTVYEASNCDRVLLIRFHDLKKTYYKTLYNSWSAIAEYKAEDCASIQYRLQNQPTASIFAALQRLEAQKITLFELPQVDDSNDTNLDYAIKPSMLFTDSDIIKVLCYSYSIRPGAIEAILVMQYYSDRQETHASESLDHILDEVKKITPLLERQHYNLQETLYNIWG